MDKIRILIFYSTYIFPGISFTRPPGLAKTQGFSFLIPKTHRKTHGFLGFCVFGLGFSKYVHNVKGQEKPIKPKNPTEFHTQKPRKTQLPKNPKTHGQPTLVKNRRQFGPNCHQILRPLYDIQQVLFVCHAQT